MGLPLRRPRPLAPCGPDQHQDGCAVRISGVEHELEGDVPAEARAAERARSESESQAEPRVLIVRVVNEERAARVARFAFPSAVFELRSNGGNADFNGLPGLPSIDAVAAHDLYA